MNAPTLYQDPLQDPTLAPWRAQPVCRDCGGAMNTFHVWVARCDACAARQAGIEARGVPEWVLPLVLGAAGGALVTWFLTRQDRAA